MEGLSDPAKRIDALCESVRRLAAYEPESSSSQRAPRAALRRSGREHRRRRSTAHRRSSGLRGGVRLGFEPIHPSQSETAGFVTSLADALCASRRGRGSTTSGSWPTRTTSPTRKPAAFVASRRPSSPASTSPTSCPSHVPGVRALPGAQGRSVEARRRASARRLGRHARRGDLLDARRVLGAPRGRGRTPRVRGRLGADLSRVDDLPLDRLDELWDFGDPAGERAAFRGAASSRPFGARAARTSPRR